MTTGLIVEEINGEWELDERELSNIVRALENIERELRYESHKLFSRQVRDAINAIEDMSRAIRRME